MINATTRNVVPRGYLPTLLMKECLSQSTIISVQRITSCKHTHTRESGTRVADGMRIRGEFEVRNGAGDKDDGEG